MSLPCDPISSRFLDVEPQFQYSLDPNLLLRHASGQLYQEAHIALDRPVQPQLFPGTTEVTTRKHPPARSDVRFTPVPLVRTLVQEALNAWGDIDSRKSIEIMDPACGAGVFLTHSIQELAHRGYKGAIRVRGIDLSPVSCDMARFCLEYARQESSHGPEIVIEESDALDSDWGHPDIVIMNPPFIHTDRMSEREHRKVKDILGGLDQGRSDVAMAFAWKAFQSIEPGGVVATILPAPLLETAAGAKWRDFLAQHADIVLLGCFRGYGYFKGAKIEPAIIVMRKPRAKRRELVPVRLIIACDGHEDVALRSLRKGINEVPAKQDGYEIYESDPADLFSMPTWALRSEGYNKARDRLKSLNLPKVQDLFDVRQGAITGLNAAFIIPSTVYQRYSARERKYFRPAASTGSIRDGKLEPTSYVFYPYDHAGLILTTEQQARSELPKYYKEYLEPNKNRLLARADDASQSRLHDSWWQLTREREWQRLRQPKLVSAYFGGRGRFAYDEQGAYVVAQGYAWLWRESAMANEGPNGPEDLESTGGFHSSLLPWSYLAIQNSDIFEQFLSFCCPQMQGGATQPVRSLCVRGVPSES